MVEYNVGHILRSVGRIYVPGMINCELEYPSIRAILDGNLVATPKYLVDGHKGENIFSVVLDGTRDKPLFTRQKVKINQQREIGGYTYENLGFDGFISSDFELDSAQTSITEFEDEVNELFSARARKNPRWLSVAKPAVNCA